MFAKLTAISFKSVKKYDMNYKLSTCHNNYIALILISQ